MVKQRFYHALNEMQSSESLNEGHHLRSRQIGDTIDKRTVLDPFITAFVLK